MVRQMTPLAEPLPFLMDAVRELNQADALPELLETLCARAVKFAPSSHSIVCLYEAGSEMLQIAAATDPTVTVGMRFSTQLDWSARKISSSVSFPLPFSLLSHVPSSALQVPMLFQAQPVGLLIVYALTARRKFNSHEAQMLELLSAQAASAIHAVRLAEQGAERERQLEQVRYVNSVLRALSLLIAETIEHDAMLQHVLVLLYSLIPFDIGAVLIRRDGMHLTRIGISKGQNELTMDRGRDSIALYEYPMLREIVATSEMMYIPDLSQEPHWWGHLPGLTSGSWIGVPLVAGKRIVGLLSLGSQRTNFFTEEHIQTLKILAAPIALLIQNVHLLQQARKQVSELRRRVLTAEEEERKRVSRELHDETGQALTALTINLELIQQELVGQKQTLVDRVRDSVAITRQTMQQLNTLARQLRPPALELLGLVGALEQMCIDFEHRNKIQVEFSTQGIDKLPESINLTLYRFVQEALTNIAKHAQASQIQVRVECANNTLRALVRDNGKGFDAQERLKGPRRLGRLGLLGMQERLAMIGGKLDIQTQPGDGTLLVANIPITENGETESQK